MSTITALIIDDEEHNRSVLNTLLKKHCPLINVIDEAIDVDDAYQKIKKSNKQHAPHGGCIYQDMPMTRYISLPF